MGNNGTVASFSCIGFDSRLIGYDGQTRPLINSVPIAAPKINAREFSMGFTWISGRETNWIDANNASLKEFDKRTVSAWIRVPGIENAQGTPNRFSLAADGLESIGRPEVMGETVEPNKGEMVYTKIDDSSVFSTNPVSKFRGRETSLKQFEIISGSCVLIMNNTKRQFLIPQHPVWGGYVVCPLEKANNP